MPAAPVTLSGVTSNKDCHYPMDNQTRQNGTVKWFDAKKGFGFIKPDNSDKDIFVHITAVQEANIQRLKDNQRISFELVSDSRSNKQSAGKLELINE